VNGRARDETELPFDDIVVVAVLGACGIAIS
jgi:hypothetical protein